MTDTSLIATRSASAGAGLFALTVAGVAQAADVSLHNTAIAQAAVELGMTAAERSFAASVGTLAMAASILAIGNLGDRIGRRKVLLGAALALILGGVVTAASQEIVTYSAGRIITGVGLAGTLCLSMALIRAVTPRRIPKSMSLYFTGQVLFALPLTIIGGWLLGISWRYGYLVVPVVGLLAFVLNLLFTPEARSRKVGKFDGLGLSLVAIALIGIIWGVSQASSGWLRPGVLIPLIGGVVALVLFLWWESRVAEPALPVKLFKHPSLAGALTADVSFNMFQAVMILQLSLLWQYLYAYGPLEVTIGQLPATIAMALGAFAAGRLIAGGRRPQLVALAGLLGVAVAMVVFGFAGLDTPYWVFAIGLLLGGFSRMLTETSAGGFFVGIPPADLVGATVASKPAIGQAAFALGLALSSTLLYSGIGTRITDAMNDSGLTASQQASVSGWFAGGQTPANVASQDTLDALRGAAEDAYIDSYRMTMFIFAAVFFLLFGLAAYFFWWKQRGLVAEEAAKVDSE